MEATKKDIPAGPAGKTFDSVKMMREIRDLISAETQHMSFDELKEYIKGQLAKSKTKLVGKP